MAYSPADKRRVFLAYRAVFAGNNVHIRKHKKILDNVLAHKSSFGPLIKDFGTDKIVEILRNLLERRIFESELQAKVEFPELFQTSPARDVQRFKSENDAARSEAEALEEMQISEEKGDGGCDEDAIQSGIKELDDVVQIDAGTTGLPGSTSDEVPSLYPSYLPFKAQHLVLTTTQHVLEECCFDFVQKWLPSILCRNQWDCAEAVELTEWTRILAKRSGKIPGYTSSLSNVSFDEILFSTNRLRHIAVHRLRTTAPGIERLIQSSVRLAETLQDSQRAAKLEELHYEISSRVAAMELNKNVLEDRLAIELQEIQQQREALDKKERGLVATMLREDTENKSLVGILLEDSVQRIFEYGPSVVNCVLKDRDTHRMGIYQEDVDGAMEAASCESGNKEE